MPSRDIVVVGASAGGVEALTDLVRGLPSDFPAALLVVLHVPPQAPSALAQILDRAGVLPAHQAMNGEPIQAGHVYVAAPGLHLLLGRAEVHLSRGPSENGHRPAVDTLFRSAARHFGRRVVGVVLSGTLDDGTYGLREVKRRGGLAVVQSPDDALFPGMPQSALEHVAVDHSLPASEIGALLDRLVREPVDEKGGMQVDPEDDAELVDADIVSIEQGETMGHASGYTCPACGGALWELQEGDLLRFRCRVGHAYSPDSLISENGAALEEALWYAFRALEEKASLARRIAERARERNRVISAKRFEAEAMDAERRASVVRELVLNGAADATAE